MNQKLLMYFKQGEKFIYNNNIYTMYQLDLKSNMCELFSNGRFWAWNLYNGKEMIKVQQIIL